MLPGIVADLKAKGPAVESEGATVVSLMSLKTRKATRWASLFVGRKYGGYLHTTTDIACAKYRYSETLHADRAFYYIDSRQHSAPDASRPQRKAGYVPDSVPLEHHMFGMMLGKDGKPFKKLARAVR